MAQGTGTSGREEARAEILEAAILELRDRRGGDVTVESVAKRAGCAKGLVHYHFKRKDQLLSAVAARLWSDRAAAWERTLRGDDPKRAINAAWKLLSDEAADGITIVCAALGMRSEELVVQSVSSGRSAFAGALTDGVSALLARMGLEATVHAEELGMLLAATAEGLGLHLGGGARRKDLEQAWAAFWVGLLGLTRPVG